MINRIYLITLLLVCSLTSYSATFKVEVPSGTGACYIAGSFNGWDAANAPEMTKIDATHFELDLPDVTDLGDGYKYLCGPAWTYVEKNADGSERGNRTSTTQMDVVEKWASIYNPSIAPGPITINAKVPANTPVDNVFITGSFQNWEAENAIKMNMNGNGTYSITIPDCTQIMYKLLCGRSFDYVENIEADRSANSSDAVYNIEVKSWNKMPPANTTNLGRISGLGIWICTPPDYNTSGKSYPVTYIQDGQNVFTETDEIVGSWNMADVMQTLYNEKKNPGIIVGIEKDPTFMYDYSPCENDLFSKTGGADKYIETIVNEIVPYINTNYRTLTGSENTAIAGSDMGGLLAFYAAITHPETFGKSAIMSPYFWFCKDFLMSKISELNLDKVNKMLILSGDAEGNIIPADAKTITDELLTRSVPVTYNLIKGGLHTNQSWGTQFNNAYAFLFGNTTENELTKNLQSTADILSRERNKILAEEQGIKNAPYQFMSDDGKGNPSCTGDEPFTYQKCDVKGSETEIAAYVKVIPASFKSTWYSNINASEDCTGSTLSTSNYKVSFKSSKSKDSWLRYYINPETNSVDIINASSEGFRVNGILMSRCDSEGNPGSDDSYSVKATINTVTSKTYTVNYGSVNSQSDMGAITEGLSVPEKATKVEVIYSFLTNKTKLNILETDGGDIDPETNYQFMPHSDSGATCTGGHAFYATSYYPNGNNETALNRMGYIYSVPTSVTGKWYFNANNSGDCTGSNVYESDRSVSFSTRNAGDAWIRVIIDETGKATDVAASSKFFRIKQGDGIQTLMIPSGAEYEQSADIDIDSEPAGKLEIRFGSVNSGSAQGSLIGSSDTYPITLPQEWKRAHVTYNFLTNQVTYSEITGPVEKGPELEYLRTSQGVCEVGANIKVKAKINNSQNSDIKFYMSYNRGESKLYPHEKNGEEFNYNFTAEAGIYFIKVTVTDQSGKTTTLDEICVKVISDDKDRYLSSNPYEGIDWASVNQYKGTFHVHTDWKPDCSLPAHNMIDRYHSKDYKILPLTNHNYNTYPMSLLDMFKPEWENRDMESMGMLSFPAIELSKNNHHNDFFTGRCDGGADLEKSFAMTKEMNGMQIINHPGQYWSIDTKYSPGEKNSPEWHAKNFMNYETLVGIEAYNQGNRRPNDRILWDEILSLTMPERPVYGYSNDDSHHDYQCFTNYEFMLMDELTVPALKNCMKKGNFYASYEPSGTGNALAPRIKDVIIDDLSKTITVTPDNGTVYWIAGVENYGKDRKSAVIGVGNSISYENIRTPYIRAMVKNKYGETILQPFGFAYSTPDGISTEKSKKDHNITVYPNPTHGEVNINCNDKINSVILYSLSGSIIKKYETPDSKLSLDVAQGAYIIKIVTEYSIESQIIIVK